jgi:hypothetical protein
MAENSGFFNAQLNADGETYDREYYAKDWAQLLAIFLTNGIRNGGENMKVTSVGGMDVQVAPGQALINGYWYTLYDAPLVFSLAEGATGQARIDKVVLRLDLNEPARIVTAAVLQGTPSDNPAAPALTRSNAVWELGLANVRVNAGVSSITNARITDLRLNNAECGLINSLIQADTTNIYNQMQAYITQKQAEFNSIQSQEQADWNILYQGFLSWFNLAQTDIERAAQFDFDNMYALPGNVKSVTFNANGSISEWVKNKTSSNNVANRETVFNANGSITETETVWDATGQTTLRKTALSTVFNANGSITLEAVTVL